MTSILSDEKWSHFPKLTLTGWWAKSSCRLSADCLQIVGSCRQRVGGLFGCSTALSSAVHVRKPPRTFHSGIVWRLRQLNNLAPPVPPLSSSQRIRQSPFFIKSTCICIYQHSVRKSRARRPVICQSPLLNTGQFGPIDNYISTYNMIKSLATDLDQMPLTASKNLLWYRYLCDTKRLYLSKNL